MLEILSTHLLYLHYIQEFGSILAFLICNTSTVYTRDMTAE